MSGSCSVRTTAWRPSSPSTSATAGTWKPVMTEPADFRHRKSATTVPLQGPAHVVGDRGDHAARRQGNGCRRLDPGIRPFAPLSCARQNRSVYLVLILPQPSLYCTNV